MVRSVMDIIGICGHHALDIPTAYVPRCDFETAKELAKAPDDSFPSWCRPELPEDADTVGWKALQQVWTTPVTKRQEKTRITGAGVVYCLFL